MLLVVHRQNMSRRIESDLSLRLFIAEWRERRGLSQDALADRVGTTKASISRWETGNRDITGKSLATVAAALGIDAAHLFRHPDDPSLDDLLANASPSLRRKAIAVIQVLLTEDVASSGTVLTPTKSKH